MVVLSPTGSHFGFMRTNSHYRKDRIWLGGLEPIAFVTETDEKGVSRFPSGDFFGPQPRFLDEMPQGLCFKTTRTLSRHPTGSHLAHLEATMLRLLLSFLTSTLKRVPRLWKTPRNMWQSRVKKQNCEIRFFRALAYQKMLPWVGGTLFQNRRLQIPNQHNQ